MKDVIAKYLEPLLLTLITLFSPIKAVLLTTGFLIAADLVTGIMAAKKKGQPITSAGLRRTASKIFIYHLALITGFLIEKYMLEDFFPLSKMVSGIIGLVEGKSIFENLSIIYGQNLFKGIVSKLGSANDILEETKEEVKKGE